MHATISEEAVSLIAGYAFIHVACRQRRGAALLIITRGRSAWVVRQIVTCTAELLRGASDCILSDGAETAEVCVAHRLYSRATCCQLVGGSGKTKNSMGEDISGREMKDGAELSLGIYIVTAL